MSILDVDAARVEDVDAEGFAASARPLNFYYYPAVLAVVGVVYYSVPVISVMTCTPTSVIIVLRLVTACKV